MPEASDARRRGEFARRLNEAMVDRGWTQSELARNAGLGRYVVSNYIRGRSLPSAASLAALAKALELDPEVLVPDPSELPAPDGGATPELQFEVLAHDPSRALLRVNKILDVRKALQIAIILAKAEE